MTDAIGLGDLRLACKQYAKLYFHFCKTLKDDLGEGKSFPLVQKAVFELSLERTNGARKRAAALELETTVENFSKVNDIPQTAWSCWNPEMGGVRCPYAEVWLEYFEKNPWFKRFASLYCDVIDTTNAENFTRATSHKITGNLLWGDASCEHEYFESEDVKKGKFTYGRINNLNSRSE